MGIEQKAALIKQEILDSVMCGCYAFELGGPYTDSRIDLQKLYQAKHRKDLLDIGASVVLEAPTAGVVGFAHEYHMKWVELLGNALKRRGVYELPFTEMWRGGGFVVRGLPFDQYFPGAPVTIFTIVHTLGREISAVKHIVESKGLKATRAVSLINRYPSPVTQVAGLPFSCVLHFPMPLYDNIAEARINSSSQDRFSSYYDSINQLEFLLG